MSENLILTDLFDNETGSASKEEAHRIGLLHRAFSVFITSGDKMLIQKRSRNKYHSGGLWANACCSHPRVGEELNQAVQRRLKEELGISCEAKELFDFVYFSQYGEELFEYEYDHVFLAEYSGSFDFDPEEIEELKWVDMNELKRKMLEEPRGFSSWFMIAAPRVMRIIEEG